MALDAFSVLASPVGPPTLVTVAGNSTYRSTDQGSTWTRLHTLAQGWQPKRLAALDPHRPRTIYGIGTNGQIDTVLKSTDGGRSWASPSLPYYCEGGPPCEATIHAMTLDLRNPVSVYASGFLSTHFQGTGSFVLRSDDAFQTSTLLQGSPPLTGLAVDPDRSGTVYGLSCEGFFKSIDAGVSWRQTGRNLPAGVCGTAIALDPRDHRKIWVGTAGKGVFFSSDGGGTFQSMRRGLETARIGALLFDPENPARLYAGVAEKGVYQWNAASRRWSRLPNPGLPAAGYTGILTLDPQHPAVLFASHLEKGIFRLDREDTAP